MSGYNAEEHLKNLIRKAGISRIILVDDDYDQTANDGGIGLHAVINALESNRDNSTLMERARSLSLDVYGLNLFGLGGELEDNDVLLNTLTEHWDEDVPSEKKKEFFDVFGLKDTTSDTNAATESLSALVGDAATVVAKGVSDWLEESQELLEQTYDANKFVLVLFDLNLKNFGATEARFGRYDKAGYQLVRETLKAGNEHIIPGIMTNEAATEAEELKLSDEQFGLGITAAAITKKRFQSDKKTARGLEMVVAAHALYAMEHEVKSAFQNIAQNKCWGDVLELRALLEMAKEAENEGCHVSESLLRVMQRRSSDALSFGVRDACKNNAAIRILDNFEATWFGGMLVEKNAIEDLDKKPLLYKDTYVSGQDLAKHRMPTNLGDIYQIRRLSGVGDCYVLLQQPCNIAIRSNGSRKTHTQDFVLARIIEGNEKEKRQEVSQSGPLTVPSSTEEQLGGTSLAGKTKCHISFLDYIHMPPWIVDLCVYSDDGEARSLVKADLVGGPIERGWQVYGATLLEELGHRIAKYQGLLDIQSLEVESETAHLLALAVFGLPNIVNIKRTEDGRIDFGVRRIARLRDNIAQGILTEFARYQSRAAYPSKLL